MMHDGGGDRSETIAALDQLIPALQARGYTFDTVTGAVGAVSPLAPANSVARWKGKGRISRSRCRTSSCAGSGGPCSCRGSSGRRRGAVGAFRREALARVGGVSDDTLAEDTDRTMAVIRDGWRAVYEERAVAWTEAPSTLRQFWRQRYRWCYGTLQAMWKHRRSVLRRGAEGSWGGAG